MAVGTSLAVIALNSSTGLLGQLRFVDLDWSLLMGFLVFALSGMIIGTAFTLFVVPSIYMLVAKRHVRLEAIEPEPAFPETEEAAAV